MLFSGKMIAQVQDLHVLLQIFIWSVKLLKTTTDGAASQRSNEIHLKLDNCQLNRISFDTSVILATWPEFWANGLSFLTEFLGLLFIFAFLAARAALYLPS